MIDLNEIKKILPHRFPFLLIDRVLELEQGESCKALKNVTANEQFFEGHFPGFSVMPGVLIVEAMAQTCGIIVNSQGDAPKDQWMLFAGIDKARFKRPVVPGDQLILETKFLSRKMSLWVFEGKALVDGKVVAQAEIRMATMEKEA